MSTSCRLIRPLCSAFIVLVVGGALGRGQAPIDSIYLGLGQMRDSREGDVWYRPSVFERELCRQAVLIAAREELGLRTRDAALREPAPAGDNCLRLTFELANLQAKQIEYKLLRDEATLVEGSIPYAFSADHSAFAIMATAAEKLTREDFKEALSELASTRPKHALSDVEVQEKLDGAEKQLKPMNVASQFLAVRLGHDLLQHDSTSTAALSILARGYAHLAVMSDYYLTNVRVTFAARSLLYATRIANLHPESPAGYWHQAYLFTLFGLTKDSLWQLELADKHASAAQAKEPSWLPLIRRANYFDYYALREAVKTNVPDLQLAALLWFRTVECSDSQALTIETGKQAYDVNPACLRILDGIDRVAGVSYRHLTTALPAQIFAQILRSGLPLLASDSAILDDCAGDDLTVYADPRESAGLATRLIARSVDDTREPSIGVFGCLIDETNALQVVQRAMFLTRLLSVDTDDFMEAVQPVIESHPAAHFMRAIGKSRYDTEGQQAELKTGGKPDLSFITGHQRLVWYFPDPWSVNDGEIRDYKWLLQNQSPPTELDYALKLKMVDDKTAVQMGHYMGDINPYSPQRGIVLLSKDWEQERNHLQQWLDRAAEQPAIASELARQFLRQGDRQRAEEYLRKYLDVAADYDTYLRLARLLYGDGRQQEALDVAQEYLEQEDYGLSHANMNARIAYTYMADDQYEMALPWATAAAESGAGWAYHTLALCLEALGRFDEAEQVRAENDQRYGSATIYPYAVRTGNVDLDEAWKVKHASLRRKHGEDSREYRYYKAFHQLFKGDIDEAVTSLLAWVGETREPTSALVAVYAAPGAQDPQRLEQAAKVMREVNVYAKSAPELAELMELVDNEATNKNFERDRFAKLLANDKLDTNTRAVSLLLHGWCLERHGEQAEAIKSYRSAAELPGQSTSSQLACQRLRALGEKVPYEREVYLGLQYDPDAP